MPTSYNTHKGRYVPYSFAHKGDVFVRGVSSIPPVYTTVTRRDTGRRYVRKMRTNAAPSITVSDIIGLIEDQGQPKKKLETLVLYGGRVDGEPRLDDRPFEGHDVALRFTRTAQHIGFRYWFVCPRCGARRHRVYVVPLEGKDVWGCRQCLGLSYPSQHGHKTLWHDNKTVGRKGTGICGWTPCEPGGKTPEVRTRAHIRISKRTEKLFDQMRRLLDTYD